MHKTSNSPSLSDTPVVILAGGLGTRISEETVLKPKPMVEIGGRPILWHVMDIYAAHGCRNFVIACGYKGGVIKEYFRNYHLNNSDWSINLTSGQLTIVSSDSPDWEVSVLDTGLHTLTAGRLKRLQDRLKTTFMVTYGDGVGNVDIEGLLKFHHSHRRLATVTIVRPPARFGSVVLDGERVVEFTEKEATREGWINGGFFVFEPEVLNYIQGDDVSLEAVVLKRLAEDGQLQAWHHPGFWQPMDTLREKHLLESLWQSGNAPWRTRS
jgi:glucose-1-phosphate cytidylyltransferase